MSSFRLVFLSRLLPSPVRIQLAILGLSLLGGICSTQAQSPPFSGDLALLFIEEQVAFGPRVPESDAHRRTLDWMERKLDTGGGLYFRQQFVASRGEREPLELTNVIARFGPLRDGGLLIGAHWDSRPWADRDPDSTHHETPVPGANDGASGTAVLLVLADILGRYPPPIPVTLVFFDGEDLGRPGAEEDWLLGSKYFAAYWPVDRPQVALVIDMVCRSDQLYDREGMCQATSPEVYGLLESIEESLGYFLLSRQVRDPITDDHLPLLQAGIPTGLLIGLEDPDWHTLNDLPGNCSAEALQQMGSLLVEMVYGSYLH
ncbi:MAG: M28 family peptidase [Candidatus Eisenbacteria bacterium]|nr:M28 family peptidase [Candidatus Eisenbacteria bacterium]